MKNGCVYFVMILLGGLYSCGTSSYQEPRTIENKKLVFQDIIEDTTAAIEGVNYRSLGFGTMKVYKPSTFDKLDSLYTVKDEFLENNDYKGLQKSGVEEMIPVYREIAKKDADKVEYEMEHIYQSSAGDNLKIQHSFYVFNAADSLKIITPFYHFYIPKRDQELFYSYLFNEHFITERDLYISKDEMDFLNFFKAREYELIRTDELTGFMQHTMTVMSVAKQLETIDFREIAKVLAVVGLKNKYLELEVTNFGKLYTLKEQERVVGYEMDLKWKNTAGNQQENSRITFDAYLDIKDISDVKE